MQTIYREERNFDKRADRYEQDKMDMAEKVVKEAMKRDRNIYFINPKNYTGDDHVTSTDGIHPSALGYYRWAKTIEPLLLTILKKYRIE
jgi:lysophospholipase L1-like esterase